MTYLNKPRLFGGTTFLSAFFPCLLFVYVLSRGYDSGFIRTVSSVEGVAFEIAAPFVLGAALKIHSSNLWEGI
jgi:threonine/homoserine/homoserine lactone efflux protein